MVKKSIGMLNRRQILKRAASASVIAGLAGCTGDGSTEETEDGETETPTPAPDAEWKQNLPRCSSGDYTFKVRGVNIDGRRVTVSIENTGVEAYELYQVGVESRDSTGSEWVQEFTDVVLEGGESASFELDTGLGQVESVLDVSVNVSGESGFETCW